MIYLLVAGLWIMFSDELLRKLITDPDLITRFQTYKGLLYVLVTSGGLFLLILQYDREREQLKTDYDLEIELLNKLFKRIPAMINLYDPELEQFRVNREFETVLGWNNSDIEDLDLLEACFPDPDYRKEVADFMDHPGSGWKDLVVKAKDGNQIYSSWTNIKLSDDTQVGIGLDLTERRKWEVELQESRKLLRNTFESLEESVILVEPETRKITDCNNATEQIFGYRREEMIGNTTRMLHLDDENFRKFDLIGNEELQQTGSFKTEFQMKKKNGEIFDSDHTVTFVYDDDGKVQRVVSVIRDITERKRYREELKQRNTFIETTLEKLPIGVAVNRIDDGQTTFLNERFTEIYGWPPEALANVDDFFNRVYQDKSRRESIRQQVMEDMESRDLDRLSWHNVPINTKEGSTRYVDNRAIPIYDQNLMISTAIDVTQRTLLEQKLRESEEKYRHLFENNPEPMWIYNPETLHFVEVNRAAVKHYGYTEEEFLNLTLLDIRPDEDEEALRKDIEEHRGRGSYAEEWTHIKKDGTLIDVEVSAADVDYGNQTYRLVLVNDVTERKKLQEKMIQSMIEGEDRERRRIAHELHDGIGQYLSASSMNLESLKSDLKHLPEHRKKRYETGISLLKKAIRESRNLAHNLMPDVLQDYGLVLALKSLLDQMNKSFDIRFDFDTNLDDSILEARAAVNLYRIIQEALNNAVKHANCSAVSIQLYRDRQQLRCMIEDNGTGMYLDGRDLLQGMGLKSMKTRTQAISGSINFESRPGKGMTILIEVPVDQ